MNKLLTITALVLSLSGGVAFAQDSGDTDGQGAADTSGSASGTDGQGETAGDTTNAPNAPFLGNRDIIGSFFTDDTMTTMRTDDEFRTAYEALTDEQRAGIMTECEATDDSMRPFCDAFTATGSTTNN
jgi:hypothetical protein